jgi:NurA-like 5'-3' nuclease
MPAVEVSVHDWTWYTVVPDAGWLDFSGKASESAHAGKKPLKFVMTLTSSKAWELSIGDGDSILADGFCGCLDCESGNLLSNKVGYTWAG